MGKKLLLSQALIKRTQITLKTKAKRSEKKSKSQKEKKKKIHHITLNIHALTRGHARMSADATER